MFAGYKRIVVLTGAGISRAAGLPTYRGPGGLWNNPANVELNTIEALRDRRTDVCSMFWKFRAAIGGVAPTAGHRALAAFERALPAGSSMLIVTQNIDGLHQRAGSIGVTEYHGALSRWSCERCKVEIEPPRIDTDPSPPSHCDELMRPSVVLFGETIPVAAEHTTKRALRDCDLFVAIGTSGTVSPASSFVRWAKLNSARTVLLNLETFDDAGELFTDVELGTADELVPKWFSS